MERIRLFKVSVGICITLAVMIMLPLTVAAQKTPEKPIELKYAHFMPPGSYAAEHGIDAWLDQIEKATKGRVKITRYPSQTLIKAADSWEGVKTGVTDMAFCFHGYWPGMTPLSDVITLPAFPIFKGEDYAAVLWQLYEKFPEIQAEYKDVKVLVFMTHHRYILVSRKPIKTLEDLKGMKIRVAAGPPVDQMKALGGVPIMMPFPEIYQSLDKGIIDGVTMPYEALYNWKIAEVAKYVTAAPLTSTYHTYPMNLKKWNSLPPDIQKAIMSVSGLEGSKFVSRGYSDMPGEFAIEQCKKAGIEVVIYKLPPEELKRWEEIGGKPVWKAWVEKMEAKGYPGAQKILDETLKLAEARK